MTLDQVLKAIKLELQHARQKFPGDNATFAALVEEVGEVGTAIMEQSRDEVKDECVQVAVMAIRLILDGDCTMNAWREKKNLDPLV